jgi:hypothetical protein
LADDVRSPNFRRKVWIDNRFKQKSIDKMSSTPATLSNIDFVLSFVGTGHVGWKYLNGLKLAVCSEGSRALLNLIPFNPSPGIAFERPTPERVKWFQNEMIQRNIPTTVRYSGGQEVAAACGQLKSAASA